jgi:hypothetical protein
MSFPPQTTGRLRQWRLEKNILEGVISKLNDLTHYNIGEWVEFEVTTWEDCGLYYLAILSNDQSFQCFKVDAYDRTLG